MSKLFYDITLEEEYDKDDVPYQSRVMSDEHFDKVKNWLPKEFNKCNVHKSFDGELKDKVQSCVMTCFKKKVREEQIPTARIIIEFVPKFRLTESRRLSCWEQMDGQMTDGFGESYDRAEIPDCDGWQLKL